MGSHANISEIIYEIFNLIKSNNLHSKPELIKLAIKKDSKNLDALIDLGVVCAQNQKLEDALFIFNCLSNQLTDIRIFYNLGLLWSLKKEYRSALLNFELGLNIDPSDFACLVNKSATHNDLKEYVEALHAIDQALKLDQTIAEAWSNKGIALNGLGRTENAIQAYDQALALEPNYPEALHNKGICLFGSRKYEEAFNCYVKALTLNPKYSEAWLNKGNIFFEQKKFLNAIEDYDQAIHINPEYAEAWLNKGNVYFELGQYPNAIACYEKVLAINPSFNWVPGLLLHSNMKICNWIDFNGNLERVTSQITRNQKAMMPFAILSLIDDPALHQKCSKIYSSNLYPENYQLGVIKQNVINKIRIGYFSSDFYNHATSYLIAEVLELHDKNKFDVIGFSYGPQIKDELFNRINAAFSEFIDISNKSDLEVATLARSININIAVDLKGYTQDSRPGIFSYRVAPIQINFLGYPGTMECNYFDYILADDVIIPNHLKSFYSENVLYLPNSYQPNDRKRSVSKKIYQKMDFGLPENAFVFCCFNNNYKILPELFESWMKILNAVEHSVLWLLEDNTYVVKNIINEVKKFNVDPNRLIFAKPLPIEEHLSRHQLADLFLDTFPYNAHTTASDALWTGLPLLTIQGQSFASRVAASLLNAVNLPELISQSLNDYQNKAIYLANNTDALKSIKDKLLSNRQNCKLFDSFNYVKDLESLYENLLLN